MNSLTTPLAIARMAANRQFAYRAAALAGLVTNFFFGFLRASVLVALFAARGEAEVAGYSLQDAITYTGLTQALITWIALWGWWDLIRAIKTGDVASDLQRPISLFAYWCAQDAGRALSQLFTRSLPIMLAYAVFFRITLPATPAQWLGFALSMILAWLCSFAFRFLYSLAGFWVIDATSIGRAAAFATTFLSGFLMPVAFFPPWAQALMRLTPFPSVINTPTEIFVNVATGERMLQLLAAQAFWAAALIVAAHAVLALGLRRLTMQGG